MFCVYPSKSLCWNLVQKVSYLVCLYLKKELSICFLIIFINLKYLFLEASSSYSVSSSNSYQGSFPLKNEIFMYFYEEDKFQQSMDSWIQMGGIKQKR